MDDSLGFLEFFFDSTMGLQGYQEKDQTVMGPVQYLVLEPEGGVRFLEG